MCKVNEPRRGSCKLVHTSLIIRKIKLVAYIFYLGFDQNFEEKSYI